LIGTVYRRVCPGKRWPRLYGSSVDQGNQAAISVF
jgi:hypothetical protein